MTDISADMRDLLTSSEPETKQAIDYSVFRIRRELGVLSGIMDGINALVFCGGIGGSASQLRDQLLEGMEYFGLNLAFEANEDKEVNIGSDPTLAISCFNR